MSLIVRDQGGGDFEQIPEGHYIARCYKIIDLGTQTAEWSGETKQREKIMFSWEILDDDTRMKDGQPFTISKRYTSSLHEKSQLRKDLQAWRGRRFTDEELEAFDLKNVLGAYCQIQVLHGAGKNDRVYENIEAIMYTKEKPTAVNKDIFFDLSEPDMDVFDTFSDRLQETIKASPEFEALDAFGGAARSDGVTPADFPADATDQDVALPNMNAPIEAAPVPAVTVNDDATDMKAAIELAHAELTESGFSTTLQQKVFMTKVIGTGTIKTMEQAEQVMAALEA